MTFQGHSVGVAVASWPGSPVLQTVTVTAKLLVWKDFKVRPPPDLALRMQMPVN
jgi:hypothetical protein